LKIELLKLPKRGRSHYVMSCLFELCHKVRSHLPFTWWACLALCPHSLLALPWDIVFGFIIEYSSLMDFGP
jgi:hypothetical protein